MATTSAWAVGSLVEMTSFQPSATMTPLRTITAANGPPWLVRTHSSARSTARCMKSSWVMMCSRLTTARRVGNAPDKNRGSHSDRRGALPTRSNIAAPTGWAKSRQVDPLQRPPPCPPPHAGEGREGGIIGEKRRRNRDVVEHHQRPEDFRHTDGFKRRHPHRAGARSNRSGAEFGDAHGIFSRQAADDATAPNTPPCILIILIAA